MGIAYHRLSAKHKRRNGMSKKVLLVDDTETVLMFEKMMLAGTGHQIVTAKNGVEALKVAEEVCPDIILLDIMMPEMDGIETCQRLKDSAKTKDIPVVMVTTKGDPDRVERAYSAGCNDYLTKPLDKLDLLAKVRKHLGESD